MAASLPLIRIIILIKFVLINTISLNINADKIGKNDQNRKYFPVIADLFSLLLMLVED
jgi:hypothetical protein